MAIIILMYATDSRRVVQAKGDGAVTEAATYAIRMVKSKGLLHFLVAVLSPFYLVFPACLDRMVHKQYAAISKKIESKVTKRGDFVIKVSNWCALVAMGVYVVG